ncbi:unnamed protein product [Urochloa humidicola]
MLPAVARAVAAANGKLRRRARDPAAGSSGGYTCGGGRIQRRPGGAPASAGIEHRLQASPGARAGGGRWESAGASRERRVEWLRRASTGAMCGGGRAQDQGVDAGSSGGRAGGDPMAGIRRWVEGSLASGSEQAASQWWGNGGDGGRRW